MITNRLAAAFAALAMLSGQISAQMTAPVSLQGRIDGVPDGPQPLTLRIWDAAQGGGLVVSVPFTAQVSGGAFSATIDAPTAAFTLADRWWSVASSGGEMSRQRLASSPTAVFSGSAGALTAPGGGRLQMWDSYAPPLGGGPSLVGATTLPSGGSVETGYGILGSFVIPFHGNRSSPVTHEHTLLAYAPYGYTGGNGFTRAWIYVGHEDDTSFFRFRTGRAGEPGYRDTLVLRGGTVEIPEPPTGSLALRVAGHTRVGVLTITGGSDLAEPFAASPSSVIRPVAGMVLSIDPDTPGALRVATDAYDTKVAGVYSGGNDLPTGLLMGKDGCELTGASEDTLPLAMTGRVWVFADASAGDIMPGDRLTTSGEKPGHAMKAVDRDRADGAVIGKAMTPIDPDTGMVLVLVNLQ